MTAASIALRAAAVVTLAAIVSAESSITVRRSPALQAFEVASIKPKGPFRGPAEVGVSFLPGGRVVAVNAPIYLLLMVAFGSSEHQLELKGVPAGILNEVFDIEAKAGPGEQDALPDGAPKEARDARLQLMLQRLLVDRFKLKFHKETRELPIYALTVAPGGPKLTASPANRECPPDVRCGHMPGGPASGIKGLNVEISDLVDTLISFGDRHIVDRTGINGKFDITLPPWNRSTQVSTTAAASGMEPAEDPNNLTIGALLRRELGLRLESIRGPLEILVVDHIERPTPNAPTPLKELK
jgi:uncharacterized protein (TIGR03435 family)